MSDRDDWRDRAACRGMPPELWYPNEDRRGPWVSTGEARRTCAGCPVKPECLDFALATEQRDGIWGGLTPKQRQRLTKTA